MKTHVKFIKHPRLGLPVEGLRFLCLSPLGFSSVGLGFSWLPPLGFLRSSPVGLEFPWLPPFRVSGVIRVSMVDADKELKDAGDDIDNVKNYITGWEINDCYDSKAIFIDIDGDGIIRSERELKHPSEDVREALELFSLP